jgi:predicted nucleotidyltransferase
MKPEFAKAVDQIKKLGKNKRYLGAYIFGSVARGEEIDESDLDVKVIVDKGHCDNISHPFINGKKLDITFMTFAQHIDMLERQVKKAERIPMIAESIILFDKTGKLKTLKKKYQKIKPKKYTKAEHATAQFWIFHADSKIARALKKKDFLTAELGMHMNLKDVLKIYYQIKGKRWTSDKRIFQDLKTWDKILAKLLAMYLMEKIIQKKHQAWTKIIDHIVKPLGGRQDVREIICKCASCRKDLICLLKKK